MSEELGVALIGAGRVASGHARAIAETPGAKLVAATDISRERVEAFGQQHGCDTYTDWADALRRDDVQIVMIGLPNFLHERATVDACEAGKHVFVEKPMADTLEECDRMIAAAERAGVQLLVGHSQRYFASTVRAREIVQGGQIGEPVFATDTWYKPFGIASRLPWFLDRAQGGGMWLMNGAHMIDRTCWVLDTHVVGVKGWVGSPFHNLSADDANMALLSLTNGKHATIVHAGYKEAGVTKCEVEITGTGGMLLFDSYSNRLETNQDGAYRPHEIERVNPFTEELRNLVAAVRGTETLRVPPSWGRHIVEVLLACEESSRTGKEVAIG